MDETAIRVIIATVALIVGTFIGYFIGKGRNKTETKDRLTQLQLLSLPMFFGYLIITSTTDAQYSDLVATGILAITAGEWVGKAISERISNK